MPGRGVTFFKENLLQALAAWLKSAGSGSTRLLPSTAFGKTVISISMMRVDPQVLLWGPFFLLSVGSRARSRSAGSAESLFGTAYRLKLAGLSVSKVGINPQLLMVHRLTIPFVASFNLPSVSFCVISITKE